MNFKRLLSPAFVVCITLFIAASIAMGAMVRGLKAYLIKLPVEVEQRVSSIPTETEHWIQVGTDRREEAAVEGVLGTQNYLSRQYAKKDTLKPGPNGAPASPRIVELHLAYYTGMVDTVPHVPDRCLVGGGWSIVGSTRLVPIKLDRLIVSPDPDVPTQLGAVSRARISSPRSEHNGRRVRLPKDIEKLALRTTEFSAPGGKGRLFAGYFFVANGGIATSAEDVRLLAFDLRADYAYYLKVQVASPMPATADEYGELAQDLLNDLFPDIMLCVPDWIDVQTGDYPANNPRRKNQ
jgi:hypothetical protein